MKDRAIIVAGVMSGTSADGINVALVRIRARRQVARGHAIELLGHAEYPYPRPVRAAVLAAMNAAQAKVADLARLNFLLGELYADAVLAAQAKFKQKAALIGCHGQTLYHQGEPQNFMGKQIAATWQTGEAAVIAARVGVAVVSDFRPADMAAGGKGAPLVPYLDYLLFRKDEVGRIAQNIGGIANLTAMPAGSDIDSTIAFDTGPGNMVIDQVMDSLYGRPYDREGKIAASGKVLEKVISPILKHNFFRKSPPKTSGREEFGSDFVREFLRACGRPPKPDVVATATALTADSIALAVQRFVMPKLDRTSPREMILSGGGTKNATLIGMLRDRLTPMQVRLRLSDEFGLPSQAKEAVAFAVLAYETWNQRSSNVPSATGAKRRAILGKISYA